jgi:hypothetical protein
MKKSRRYACGKNQQEIECNDKVTTLRVCKKARVGELMKKVKTPLKRIKSHNTKRAEKNQWLC